MANHMYTYTLREGKTIDELAEIVSRFLNNENMEIQSIDQPNGKIVQARVRKGGLKQLVGMDKAVEVRLYRQDNRLTVEMGHAKWADKAAVMAVSILVMWPLAVTSGVGMYKQSKLFDQIRSVIDQYIYN